MTGVLQYTWARNTFYYPAYFSSKTFVALPGTPKNAEHEVKGLTPPN